MKYLRDFKNIDCLPDQGFDVWFKKIDRDGNGQVDMVEMAHYIKDLAKALQRPHLDEDIKERFGSHLHHPETTHKNGLQKLKVVKKISTLKDKGVNESVKIKPRKPIVVTVASLI